jgi:hypothetical protein
MDFTIAIIAGVALVGYVIYRFATRPDLEFIRYYQDIISSDQYKVKGKYED